jgi:hypothetical protein
VASDIFVLTRLLELALKEINALQVIGTQVGFARIVPFVTSFLSTSAAAAWIRFVLVPALVMKRY